MERLTQKLKIQKRGLANYLENFFDGILNIFDRSGPRAPDPDTGSSSLRKRIFLFWTPPLFPLIFEVKSSSCISKFSLKIRGFKILQRFISVPSLSINIKNNALSFLLFSFFLLNSYDFKEWVKTRTKPVPLPKISELDENLYLQYSAHLNKLLYESVCLYIRLSVTLF